MRLRACVHGPPPTEPTERTSEPPPTEPTPTEPTLSEPTPTAPPTERTSEPTPSEPPSSRDDAEALREDSVSQSKGEL